MREQTGSMMRESKASSALYSAHFRIQCCFNLFASQHANTYTLGGEGMN